MTQKTKEQLFKEMLEKAEQGDKTAQYLVGEKYWYDGYFPEATYWLRKSANKNHAESQYLLAKVLEKQGLDEESMHWLCCAHVNGLAKATNLMNENIEFHEGMGEYDGQIWFNKYQTHIALVKKVGIDYSNVLEEKRKKTQTSIIAVAVILLVIFIIIFS